MRLLILLCLLALALRPSLAQTSARPQWTLNHEFKGHVYHSFLSADGSMLAIGRGQTVD